MAEGANALLIRQAYKGFDSGDPKLLGAVMAPTVLWHEPGHSCLGGDYQGLEAVVDFLGRLKARSGDTYKAEILDLFSGPERAVVLERETATRNGNALDVIAALDVEFHEGKITEVTVYESDTDQFDEFWEDGEQPAEVDEDYEIGWGDIESELYCSSREACFGASAFLSLP
ncbi:MAG TPA: nuclear transport factor 2 family protein [Acidimicrobiales bacterium]|nr:nuclear transport factor 2 family protein [Acidimicrobiales bacterium]